MFFFAQDLTDIEERQVIMVIIRVDDESVDPGVAIVPMMLPKHPAYVRKDHLM
jgi:hypothetical protein